MATGARRDRNETGDFGEADLEAEDLGPIDERCSYPPPRIRRSSDVFALTVPPGQFPEDPVAESIEQAVRAAAEQVPRTPLPEPPPDVEDDGDDGDDDTEPEPAVVQVARPRRTRRR